MHATRYGHKTRLGGRFGPFSSNLDLFTVNPQFSLAKNLLGDGALRTSLMQEAFRRNPGESES